MQRILQDIASQASALREDVTRGMLPINFPLLDAESTEHRQFMIFRHDQRLYISQNGDLMEGEWDWIAPMQSIVLKTPASTTLYWIAFCDDYVLILNKHDTSEFRVFANDLQFSEVSLNAVLEYLDNYEEEDFEEQVNMNINIPQENLATSTPFGNVITAPTSDFKVCQICNEKPPLPDHSVCADCMDFFGV